MSAVSCSHCGGSEKLILLSVKRTREMGRALPPDPTNRPTSVCRPECRTSNQDGAFFPDMETVMSHRPSMEKGSGFCNVESAAFAVICNPVINNIRVNTLNRKGIISCLLFN